MARTIVDDRELDFCGPRIAQCLEYCYTLDCHCSCEDDCQAQHCLAQHSYVHHSIVSSMATPSMAIANIAMRSTAMQDCRGQHYQTQLPDLRDLVIV